MKKTSPQQTNAQNNPQIKAHTKTPLNDPIDELLLQLWQKNLPTIRERLDLMDKFGSAAVSGSLEEHTRLEALSIAHKLAGSLGMYGYQQGTEVAAKMERILKFPTPETLVTLRALAADLRNSLAAGL
jgi:HPt (histidine-containing phosphotransfer) domain-containing protein